MTTAATELSEAIARLYEVFARYQLRGPIDACPCCVSDEMKAAIVSKPLRALSHSDLGRYSQKAMTTWGDVDDYRHFLPRICELIANLQACSNSGANADDDCSGSEPSFDYLCMKLESAQWRDWPAIECDALRSFFVALWRAAVLDDFPEQLAAGPTLMEMYVGMRQCKFDFAPIVELCVQTLTSTAIDFLKDLVDDLTSFPVKRAIEATSTRHWHKVRLEQVGVLETLLCDETASRLETAFFSDATSIEQSDLSDLIAGTERLRHIVTNAT
jgi:hypothetical protein